MRILRREPDLTQRQLALKIGISVGAVNHCIRALVGKGMLKVRNFAQSRNKLGYAYVLTPKGIAEKGELTRAFLSRKIVEYELLRREIDVLRFEASAEGTASDQEIEWIGPTI